MAREEFLPVPKSHVEALYWALRSARLPDLVTSALTRAELVRMGLLEPERQDEADPRYIEIRAALAEHFRADAQWRAAHEELNRITGIAMECYEEPGAIEARAPGFSEDFYRQLRADTAFAMR